MVSFGERATSLALSGHAPVKLGKKVKPIWLISSTGFELLLKIFPLCNAAKITSDPASLLRADCRCTNVRNSSLDQSCSFCCCDDHTNIMQVGSL